MRPIPNLIGQTFGRWTVISLSPEMIRRDRAWICQCSCENKTVKRVLQRSLQHKLSSSCGCLKIESKTKHGMWRTPTYGSWQAMIDRCGRPGHPAYHRYGGRGISICRGLRETFSGFLKVMGERVNGTTMDRINPDGNYSCGVCEDCLSQGWPLNCRWATPKIQGNNTAFSKTFTINGVTKNQTDWCKDFGVPLSTIRLWMKRDGLTFLQAIEKRKATVISSSWKGNRKT